MLGASVQSVATNQIVSNDLIDTSATPFNATGRVLSIIGRPNASTPFASFNITAHNPATGTLTLDRDPTGIVQGGGDNLGDAFAIRNKADNLTSTPTMVTTVNDNGYKNSANNYNGLTAGAEVGNLIRVIANTGRGQPPSTITANTATSLTFSPPLTMDNTSVWIVEGPNWTFEADSTSTDNSSPLTSVSLTVPTANFIKQPMLIGGFTVDTSGNESPEGHEPLREDWIYGQRGALTSEGYNVLSIVSGQITPDLSAGVNQEAILTSAIVVNGPVNVPGPVTWTLVLVQDSTGGRAVTFDSSAYVGANYISSALSPAANTYTSIDFVVRSDGKSALSSIVTGVQLT